MLVRPSAPPTPAESLPQQHIRLAAAQTRTVSAALFRPNPRKLWRQFKWISFLTDSRVRISYAQPASPVSAWWFLGVAASLQPFLRGFDPRLEPVAFPAQGRAPWR